MKPGHWLPLVLGVGLATGPAAADSATRIELEASVARESLSRGLPDWIESGLLVERRRDDGQVLYGGLRETERYRLADSELRLGAHQPVTERMQLQFEAGASGTHRVLASRYGALGIHAQPWTGWGLSAGWRRSSYDSGNTGVANVGVEHYRGNERFAYTLFSGGPDGTGRLPSHRLQWAHYYGERDWLGIAVVSGSESEHAGNGRFLTSRISGLSLGGRLGIGPSSALAWEIGRQRQGDLYTRSGLRLGLRHAF